MIFNQVEESFYGQGQRQVPLGNAYREATRLADNTRVEDCLWQTIPGIAVTGLTLCATPGFDWLAGGLYNADTTNAKQMSYLSRPLDRLNGTYEVVVRVVTVIPSQNVAMQFQQNGTDDTGYFVRVRTDSSGNFVSDFSRQNAGVPNTLGSVTALSGVAAGDVLVFSTVRSGATFTTTYTRNGGAGTVLHGGPVTDGSPLNAPGYLGVRMSQTGGTVTESTGMQIASVRFSHPAILPSVPSVSPNATVQVAVTGLNTAWVNGTTTFALSGGTGASLAAQQVLASDRALLTVVTGSANGPLTLTDGAAAPGQAVGTLYVKPAYAAPNATQLDRFLYQDGQLPSRWRAMSNDPNSVTASGQTLVPLVGPIGGAGAQAALAWFERGLERRMPGPSGYVRALLAALPPSGATLGVGLKGYEANCLYSGYFALVRNTGGVYTLEVYRADAAGWTAGTLTFVGTLTRLVQVTQAPSAGDRLGLSYDASTGTLAMDLNGVAVPGGSVVDTTYRAMHGQAFARFGAASGSGALDDFEYGVLPGAVTLTHGTVGWLTDTTARLTFRTSEPSGVQVQYSTAADFSASPVTTAAVPTTTATDNTGRVDLTGLAPGTTYYYRHVLGGVTKDQGIARTFKTLPAAGSALSGHKIAFGSCHNIDPVNYVGAGKTADDPAFTALAASGALMCVHLGDAIYADECLPMLDPTTAEYRGKHRLYLQPGTHTRGYELARRSLGWVYLPSDHDTNNNYDQRQQDAYWGPAYKAYQEYLLANNPPPMQPGDMHTAFQVGNVGFFMTDGRAYRTHARATDDATKTLLGAQQLADLKAWLLANNAAFRFKVLCFAEAVNPWVWTGVDSPGVGYTTELNALKDWIQASGITGVVWISGDVHLSAVYLPSRGGMLCPEFGCSPFLNMVPPSPRAPSGLPTSQVPWVVHGDDAGMSGHNGFFGVLSFTTTGAVGTGTCTYSLYKDDGTLLHTYTVTEAQVNAGLYAPTVITAQPAGQSVAAGGTLSLSLTATGSALGYQWYKDGSPIVGATAAAYSKPFAASGDTGAYSCLVTGGAGSVASAAVAVAVGSGAAAPAPAVLTHAVPRGR